MPVRPHPQKRDACLKANISSPALFASRPTSYVTIGTYHFRTVQTFGVHSRVRETHPPCVATGAACNFEATRRPSKRAKSAPFQRFASTTPLAHAVSRDAQPPATPLSSPARQQIDLLRAPPIRDEASPQSEARTATSRRCPQALEQRSALRLLRRMADTRLTQMQQSPRQQSSLPMRRAAHQAAARAQ